MFELIKKWLKRPIVINFTVEPLSPDAAINVLRTERPITPEIAEAIKKSWPEFCKSKAVVLCPGVTLEQMSDEQLKDVGLVRIKSQTINIVVSEPTNLNSGIAKYLKNSAEHGKGRSIKSSDQFTVPLCHSCHFQFDTFQLGNRAESEVKRRR